ncbi:MAG: hypothetical protein OSA93_10115 [Akkermansiaceae bacterium]|nr:hypothetical protein [Akkermansiaceae bacterium]
MASVYHSNGTIWDMEAEKQSWTAKGDWCGILATPPITIALVE